MTSSKKAPSKTTIGTLLFAGVMVYIAISPTAFIVAPGAVPARKITNIAIQKKDPNICTRIWALIPINLGPSAETLRTMCVKDVAEKFNDPNICDLIKEGGEHRTCISRVTGN